MKLKYIGESFGAASLTDGQTYIATVSDVGYYRVFDDCGEDYMYFQNNPRPVDGSSPGGRWEIVEDMNDRERELYEKIKRATTPDERNALLDETLKICEEYAVKYADEIEDVVQKNLNNPNKFK